jgi:hypothetical protein
MPIPAFAAVLKPENCVSVDSDKLLWLILVAFVAVAEIVRLVRLPVIGTPYIVSMLYYKSAPGKFTV